MDKEACLYADNGSSQTTEHAPNGKGKGDPSRGSNHGIAFIQPIEQIACGLKMAAIKLDRTILTQKIKCSTGPVYGRVWINLKKAYIEATSGQFYCSVEKFAGSLTTSACSQPIETPRIENISCYTRQFCRGPIFY